MNVTPILTVKGIAFLKEHPQLLSMMYDFSCLPEEATNKEDPYAAVKAIILVMGYAAGSGLENPESLISEEYLCVD